MSEVRRHAPGVKCLIQCQDKFLLVRIAYAHKLWTLPGGRLEDGESHAEAAIRETKEEVGIHLAAVTPIGTEEFVHENIPGEIQYVHAEVPASEFAVDGREIAEAAWFHPEFLPKDRTSKIDLAFAMLDTHERN